MGSNTAEMKASTWATGLGEILARKNDPSFSGQLASIKKGLLVETEHLAYPYTQYWLSSGDDSLDSLAQRGARRAMAVAALCKAPNDSRKISIGQAIGRLNKTQLNGRGFAETPIATMVNSFPVFDVDQLAVLVASMADRCADSGIAVPYYSLARTFIYWGNGISEKSTDHRNKIMYDFYKQ